MNNVVLFLLAASIGFGAGAMAEYPPKNPVEHSGCCSHHKGVCGCDATGKHAVCCDGSTSPSCGCD
jgi:hypothetical protein